MLKMLSVINFLKENKIVVILLSIIILIFIVAVMWIIKNRKEKINSSKVATLGVFTAFSIILYFLKFNLPFIFPSFLEINFSLLPIIIIGFMLGPVEGITLVLLRAIIKIPFTSTFCVGELADVLIGVPVIVVTSLIYLKFHNRKGALLALGIGILTWVISSVAANYLINVPFFIQLYCNGDINVFVGALSIIPNVTSANYMIKYLLFAVVPFNLLISVVVSFVTFLVYKKISILFNKLNNKVKA